MKTKLFLTLSIVFLSLFFTGCGGNSQGGGKSVDVPAYIAEGTPYLSKMAGKGQFALAGKTEGNYGSVTYGLYTNGYNLVGLKAQFPDDSFVILDSGVGSLLKYAGDETNYSMQVLVTKFKEDNPYNSGVQSASSMRGFPVKAKLDINYSDTYYFVNDEKLMETKNYLETLEKKENKPSQFDAKENGGTKTYHAQIGSAVEYFGRKEFQKDRFLCLFLDCGAVVQLYDRNLFAKDMIGKTIDCVTTNDNTIVEFKLIK